uniref:Uncharacterized protein n=1 Tax=Archaeoglobus fulgidus TaxID=2234 RepID=A0A7C3M8Y8_ARCFL
MDIQTRKSILWDAFEELKTRWEVDERFLEKVDEEELTVDGLPESKVRDLIELREKYQLDELEFLFIVGAAVGLYQGQKQVKDILMRRMSVLNEFISSLIGREL